MDWNDASGYCQATEGSQLVEILTSEQMDFLKAELGSMESSVIATLSNPSVGHSVTDQF